ncbi:hypothetical protein TNCV_1969571 [Trichonephila clavipes]|nr:hypothetical protein TNCV_1969571 [Trichonephila clavipes]
MIVQFRNGKVINHGSMPAGSPLTVTLWPSSCFFKKVVLTSPSTKRLPNNPDEDIRLNESDCEESEESANVVDNISVNPSIYVVADGSNVPDIFVTRNILRQSSGPTSFAKHHVNVFEIPDDHDLQHIRDIALVVQYTGNAYERGAAVQSNTIPIHDTQCMTSGVMHKSTVHQPLTKVTLIPNPTIVMLQAEAGFVSKHNAIPFRFSCPPLIELLVAQTLVVSTRGFTMQWTPCEHSIFLQTVWCRRAPNDA